jgi:hypothetical protein
MIDYQIDPNEGLSPAMRHSPGIAAATRAAPDWLTWNLLTLAVWRDEVLADTTLTPRPGTRVLAPSSSSVF